MSVGACHLLKVNRVGDPYDEVFSLTGLTRALVLFLCWFKSGKWKRAI